jgi:hypothetical protein
MDGARTHLRPPRTLSEVILSSSSSGLLPAESPVSRCGRKLRISHVIHARLTVKLHCLFFCGKKPIQRADVVGLRHELDLKTCFTLEI